MEAVAVVREGRANPRQLMLTRTNLDAFKRLTEDIREWAVRATGREPVLVMQATHSGRYSKPEGDPAPRIACRNPLFEKDMPLPDSCILSDDELRALPERYACSARLAEEAGFDGVDIKACHRYLLNELLSAHTRPGPYGGSFENRTRLLRDAVRAAKAATAGGAFITSRLNVYDGFPYPYGWGVLPDGGVEPELEEPKRLAALLVREEGVPLLNITIGNPYVNPHVNRPYDDGPYPPPEHPFAGVARLCRCVSEIKRAEPGAAVVASGLSYMRQFSGNLAAGMIAARWGRPRGIWEAGLRVSVVCGGSARKRAAGSEEMLHLLRQMLGPDAGGQCGGLCRAGHGDLSAVLPAGRRQGFEKSGRESAPKKGVGEMNRKIASVTGSRRGIGLAIAEELGKAGYAVLLSDIVDAEEAVPVIDRLRERGIEAAYLRCDISREEDRRRFAAEVRERYGRLDVHVNNAGVAPRVRLDVLETTEESYDFLMDINLKGTFFMCQAAANLMLDFQRSGIGDYTPRIVNIASMSAYTSSTNRGEYCISKAGISMVTKLFADRLAEYGIPVFEVRPGIILTDMTAGVKEKYEKLIAGGVTPIRRFGQPKDVADCVMAAVGGRLDFATGQVLNADGGFHIRRL